MWNEWCSNRSSPWNDETTAQLPEQFYRPIISHLSHQPSNPEPCVFFVSSFILCQCPRCENPSSEKLKCRPKCRRVSSVWSRHMGGRGWHYAWMHLAFCTDCPPRSNLRGHWLFVGFESAEVYSSLTPRQKKRKRNYIHWLLYVNIIGSFTYQCKKVK